jgi:hypothetical protein
VSAAPPARTSCITAESNHQNASIGETIRLRTRRGAHILITVLVLTLYGAVAAGNAALHGLLGCGQGEWAKTTGAAGDDGPKHLCSVCHFLSQGQLANVPDTCAPNVFCVSALR